MKTTLILALITALFCTACSDDDTSTPDGAADEAGTDLSVMEVGTDLGHDGGGDGSSVDAPTPDAPAPDSGDAAE